MSTGKVRRDEFSCPCCGVGSDSGYCLACEIFECGEQDVSAPDKCLVPDGVAAWRIRHAAHYHPSASTRGHDLLTVEMTVPPGKETPRDARGNPALPFGLSAGFEYHSGHREDGWQRWRFVKTAPLSPGRCGRCT